MVILLLICITLSSQTNYIIRGIVNKSIKVNNLIFNRIKVHPYTDSLCKCITTINILKDVGTKPFLLKAITKLLTANPTSTPQYTHFLGNTVGMAVVTCE